MKQNLKLKKNEPLFKWCQRIYDYMDVPKDSEWREILSEVCKESYIRGIREWEVLIKYGRL